VKIESYFAVVLKEIERKGTPFVQKKCNPMVQNLSHKKCIHRAKAAIFFCGTHPE
jgi:hypothetical protein